MTTQKGFDNYRGRVGKTSFGDVFYDINLEVDQILPHTKSASEIKKSTSVNSLSQTSENVNNKFSEKIGKAEYEKGYYFNDEILSNVNLSAYGKYNYKNDINTARNEGRILYINKSNQPRNIPGVQFPNNILNADYSSSISNYRKNVNDFMKKFSNIDTIIEARLLAPLNLIRLN